jgi:endonuclease/exonuclease/phosphatase (EEP) superfamily protein YafD
LAINVHGLNFVKRDTYFKQLQQMEPILALHSGPIILAGDFNSWSVGRRKLLEDLGSKYGLIKVPFSKSGPLQLDGAYTRGLNVKSFEVYSDIDTSDHKPLFFEANFED